MRNDDMDRVVPLDQLDDFKVAEGDPDVRGWEVMSADGRKIGEVDELLVDTNAMKVRYLDVDVDNNLLAGEPDRHVLVPIGYARLDRDRDCVIVDSLQASQLTSLPAYGHAPLTRDFETNVRDTWSGLGTTSTAAGASGLTGTTGTAGTTGGAADDFYAHESFDDNRFYAGRRDLADTDRMGDRDEARLTLSEEELSVGKREVRAGEVEVHKRVETEHVRESVPLRHEEVTVERRPLTGADALHAEARIEGDEIRIPIHEEEVVVEKRVVPKEELVVKKREVVENQEVEADLRRERAEVHREGDLNARDDLRNPNLRDDRGGL